MLNNLSFGNYFFLYRLEKASLRLLYGYFLKCSYKVRVIVRKVEPDLICSLHTFNTEAFLFSNTTINRASCFAKLAINRLFIISTQNLVLFNVDNFSKFRVNTYNKKFGVVGFLTFTDKKTENVSYKIK